jgi:hypothetical protein
MDGEFAYFFIVDLGRVSPDDLSENIHLFSEDPVVDLYEIVFGEIFVGDYQDSRARKVESHSAVGRHTLEVSALERFVAQLDAGGLSDDAPEIQRQKKFEPQMSSTLLYVVRNKLVIIIVFDVRALLFIRQVFEYIR